MSAWPEAAWVKGNIQDYVDLTRRAENLRKKRYIVDSVWNSNPNKQLLEALVNAGKDPEKDEMLYAEDTSQNLCPAHYMNTTFEDSSLWLITE